MNRLWKYVNFLVPRKIWHQIFVSLVFLVIVPLVVLGILLIRTSQHALKNSILQDRYMVAIHATGKVEEFLNGVERTLFVTSSILGKFQGDSWQKESVITELSIRHPIFQRITLINLLGKEVASSDLQISHQNYSNHKAFIQAKQGNVYFSKVLIEKESIPNVIVAMPIEKFGRVEEVLMAEVSLNAIWHVVDHIDCGSLCTTSLIDQNANLIASDDKKLVLKKGGFQYEEIMDEVLNGKSGYYEKVGNNKQSWLISYAPLEKLNWGMVISQPTKEAYSFSRVMILQSWVLILLSILATISMSIFLARFISRPIHMIIEQTRRLTKGNFHHAFRIHRRDEIGKLLFSFNKMALRIQKVQESEKLLIIGKVSASIAHELKNSLLMINTYIDLLPKRHMEKKFIKDFSQTIPKELESWKKMLHGMMEFTEINNIPMTSVAPKEILEDVCNLIKLRIKEKGLRFQTDMQKVLPLIYGNALKLKQVFLNLVSNAIEATSFGGVISLSAVVVEDCDIEGKRVYLKVRIADTGKGIGREDLKRIFEPFYTTKQGGLGFGLATSKQIIECHEGSITATSKKGEETVFVVAIPVNKEKSQIK